jgi:hypothetical protein
LHAGGRWGLGARLDRAGGEGIGRARMSGVRAATKQRDGKHAKIEHQTTRQARTAMPNIAGDA